ncbi:MAG: hypothetical protein ABIP02_03100 [Arenimonas sp.]
MSRWIWIALGILLVLMGWQSLHSPKAAGFAANTASGQSLCPLPDKFKRSDQPLQTDVDNRIHPLHIADATFIPLAGYSLQARVLSRENYYVGNEAEFSPVDLALGWGSMAELGMADKLNISQSGRFYRYSWGNEGPPIPQNEIISHSANTHMVPANHSVANALDAISNEDIIELQGWLIRIERNDGWRWQSSLTRDDTGDGACELVYVCSVEIKR